MTKILEEVLAANAKYAENFGDKGDLPLPPSRHFAILTCMDARLDPAKYAGLAEGDAHVIRNAGQKTVDFGFQCRNALLLPVSRSLSVFDKPVDQQVLKLHDPGSFLRS